MAISVVLRLVEQALRAGRLAGEVEIVETGERALVRDEAELMRFLRPVVALDAEGPGAHGCAPAPAAPHTRTELGG